jgi:lipoprotein-releasing system ATP-binding protein
MNDRNHVIVSCQQLGKTYQEGKIETRVFHDLNLNVVSGEQVAIVGASGVGKSTLLHLLGGLDTPSSGKVLIDGLNINQLSERKRCRLRNKTLGFVYQRHHLLPEFTVLENVCMPLLLTDQTVSEMTQQATALLTAVGLRERLHHRVTDISGGERQRTAVVRALMNKPKCVFADEPTGNLDQSTAQQVYRTMLQLNRSLNTSLVIVTHDMTLANTMDRVLYLENGQLTQK